jgi:hypothetical protein
MGGFNMAIQILRGKSDSTIESIKSALAAYQKANAGAKIDLYRQNSVSVRIRIIDASFVGMTKPERHDKVWHYIEQLPEEAVSDISMLVLLTPKETKMSMANMEFDDPIPSQL